MTLLFSLQYTAGLLFPSTSVIDFIDGLYVIVLYLPFNIGKPLVMSEIDFNCQLMHGILCTSEIMNDKMAIVQVWSFDDHRAYYEMGNGSSRHGFGGFRHSNTMLSLTETT